MLVGYSHSAHDVLSSFSTEAFLVHKPSFHSSASQCSHKAWNKTATCNCFSCFWGAAMSRAGKSQGSTPSAVTCSLCKFQPFISYWLAAVRKWSATAGWNRQHLSIKCSGTIGYWHQGGTCCCSGCAKPTGAIKFCLQDTHLEVSKRKCGLDLGLNLWLLGTAGDPETKKPRGLARWWVPLPPLS